MLSIYKALIGELSIFKNQSAYIDYGLYEDSHWKLQSVGK